jgi:filamentous hemagglutinin family protein
VKKYLTLFILSSSVSLLALPSGGHVVKGDATLSLTSDAVQIKANGKAIIQWDQFDIASREAVSFAQSQTKEAVLNRVVSGSASQIYGLLQANCPIYLINPQGVFIGSAAQISTAGFLASTADISNEAFWQGSELRFENLGPGNIVNLGTITSGQGDVVFIARSIDNQGKIPAPNGVVTFTTSEVMINPETKQTVFIRVGEVEEGISNSGTIQALAIDFKTQSPYEKAIHHTGTLEALTLQEQNGRIYLVADRGGSVVDGSVIAKSGEVRLLGQEVSLQEHANVNVSGAAGGTVLIGGDYRGANPEILNAKRTSIAGGATLLADGSIGNAGRIIIWGDEVTSYQGAISCQALGKSGDGGFVEISAKSNHLKFEGVVNTLAVNGKTGELLLDPVNITVNDFGGTSTPAFPTTPPGTYAPTTVTSANLDVANVQTALATTNVIIDATTGTGGPTAGNITFVLGPTWSANTTLTAIAARTLTVSGTISATGEGSVNFTGNGQGGTAVGEGIYVQPAGVIQTNSGNITLNGTGITVSHSPSPLEQCDGILIDGQVLTNSGFINMTGQTGALAFGDEGVCIRGLVNSLVSGDILMTGSVSPSSASSNGVIIRNGGIVLSTGSGNIVLDGTSIGTGGELNTGVELAGDSATATCQALGTGNITVNGVVLSGPAAIGQGVQIATRSTLSANSGTINITGTNYATGSNNTGVTVSNTGVISSNSGDINITGQTSASSDSSQALIVTATSVIQSNSGNIVVNAVNSSPLGNAQPGIQVSGSTSTIQNVNGNIQLTGQAGGVTTSNNGIQLDSAGSLKHDRGWHHYDDGNRRGRHICYQWDFSHRDRF